MIGSRRSLFLVTVFVTFLIFIIGIFLGMKVDEMGTNDNNELLIKNGLDTESYVVESEFFDEFGIDSCSVLELRFNQLQSELADLGDELSQADIKKFSESNDFYNLKRKYFLQEISTLILAKKLSEECKTKSMNLIYFYRIGDSESLKQGYALDRLVESKNETHVFSFDIDFEDNALNSLKNYYNVTDAPTLIINFENVKKGFISYGELMHYKE